MTISFPQDELLRDLGESPKAESEPEDFGKSGGFIVPESVVEGFSDLMKHPPHGSAWKRSHPVRYWVWRWSGRLPFGLSRCLEWVWRKRYDPPAISWTTTIDKRGGSSE